MNLSTLITHTFCHSSVFMTSRDRQTDRRSIPTSKEPSNEAEREGPYRLFVSSVSHCDASGVVGADGAGDTWCAVILSVSSAQREDWHANDKTCFILQDSAWSCHDVERIRETSHTWHLLKVSVPSPRQQWDQMETFAEVTCISIASSQCNDFYFS